MSQSSKQCTSCKDKVKRVRDIGPDSLKDSLLYSDLQDKDPDQLIDPDAPIPKKESNFSFSVEREEIKEPIGNKLDRVITWFKITFKF